MKAILKWIAPPILIDLYRFLFSKPALYAFFNTWSEAHEQSRGYDADSILKKVRDAARTVKEGGACFERDSVLFFRQEYSFAITLGLLRAASLSFGELTVLDFGGSLGSTYYQNKKLLTKLQKLSWNVVEQRHFVAAGREEFTDSTLKFHLSMHDASEISRPNLILFSSVLQYLENFEEVVAEAVALEPKIIVVDRSPFLRQPARAHNVAVQFVNPSIYEGSYPSWIFERDLFIQLFSHKYEILAEVQNSDYLDHKVEFRGFVLERRD